LSTSAYNATLAVDDAAIYVLTSNAAYRVVPGEPARARALDLSYGATVTRYSFLYWSKGGVWKAPKEGGRETRIGSVAHQPQFFVSSGDDFAWVDRTDDGQFTIQTLDGRATRSLYASPGKIDAATMIHDWVFFVERVADSAWRIGRVRVGGGLPAFTETRTGRSPAMLVPWNDIYYYDGNRLEVRALSPDFQRDELRIKEFICSPMAVWERIYCAQMKGLFEFPAGSQPPRLVSDNHRRSVTNIAVNSKYVVWISDAGADQLALEMLPRSDLE
jgi:hypothetical protein